MKGEINEKEETNRGRNDPEEGGHREAGKDGSMQRRKQTLTKQAG